MGKTIYVGSFEEMASASQKLRESSQEYTQIYTRLMQAASTMGEAWDGVDNLAYVERITGFTEELKEMADKLTLASEALDKQRENYMARQDDNVTQVNKLTN